MGVLRLHRRDDGVATILFDTPDSPVNVLSRELFDEISDVLDEIESDDSVRAVVLHSAKPGTFIAGANLKQLVAIDSAEEGAAFSRGGHALLDRIDASRKPFVAAVWGACLGGGLEVALACRLIVAADDPKTQLALPEVQLGLLPGGGGTQRLVRRIGLPEALPLMLTGKRVRARKAYRMGLVDVLTSPGGIEDTAAVAALRCAAGTLKRRAPKRAPLNRVLDTPLLRSVVLRKAREQAEGKTRGNYPAPGFILDCVEAGLKGGMRAGLAKESELFGRLTAGPVAKNLIRLFESMNELKKPADTAEPRPVERLAVLGGGFMGTGIAQVSVGLGPVVVKDINDDVLAGCGKGVLDGLKRRVRSGAINGFELDRQMARLRLTTEQADVAGADLVVEAVFEDLGLKRKILADTEAVIADDAVFASNTSALPISDIAAEARRPERVLGMHYFSPVPKMPLLEIIVTERTADWALATARRYGIRQGKTVVVVKDGPGFYTSRILSPFLAEAVKLVQEGAKIEDVDGALKDFGYPVGPLALLDEVGLDVAAHVGTNFSTAFASRGFDGGDDFVKLTEAGLKGRKSKRGFYVYGEGKKKTPNEEIYGKLGNRPRTALTDDAAWRLCLLMVNEAAHCLAEGIIESPRDGDVGAILGLGFPPFRGGPFRLVDTEGRAAIVERLERLRDSHGQRFEPCRLLREPGSFH